MNYQAKCIIQSIWAKFSDEPRIRNLREFNLILWRWDSPSPRPDENGQFRPAYINKYSYRSRMKGDRLEVKCHNKDKVWTTFYETQSPLARPSSIAKSEKSSEEV